MAFLHRSPPRRAPEPDPVRAALSSTPAYARPPYDYAARDARIASGAEGPGGANHEARLEAVRNRGQVPVEDRLEEEQERAAALLGGNQPTVAYAPPTPPPQPEQLPDTPPPSGPSHQGLQEALAIALRLAFDLDVPVLGESDEQFTWSINRALAGHLQGDGRGKARGPVTPPDLFLMDRAEKAAEKAGPVYYA
jgi:hypothetical protein